MIAIYFLRVLEVENLRLGCQHGWFLVRPLFLTCKWSPSCMFTWPFPGIRKLSGVYKGTDPIRSGAYPYDII